MADALPTELREQIEARSVLGFLVLLAVLRVFLGASLVQLATTAATGAVHGLSEAAADAYDLRSEVRYLGFGGVVVLSGGALLAFGDGSSGVSAGFLVVGSWILLDAVQTLRYEGVTKSDTARDGVEVFHEYVVRRIDETLRERPRTRRELSEALDADEADVDRALETLRERGLLEREGSELRISSASDRGRLGAARDKLGSGASRLARPARLELEE